MCQIKDVTVLVDVRGKPRVVEVKLSTGEEVAFTFTVASGVVGRSGWFGSRVRLERLDPLTYDDSLFGSVNENGGAS